MFATESEAKAELLIAGAAVDAVRKRLDAMPSPQVRRKLPPHQLTALLVDAKAIVEAAEAAFDGALEVGTQVPMASMYALKMDSGMAIKGGSEQLYRARLAFSAVAGTLVATAVDVGYYAQGSGRRNDVSLARILLQSAIDAAGTVSGWQLEGLLRAPRRWLRDCQQSLRALGRVEAEIGRAA
jgi:hypothetical protein